MAFSTRKVAPDVQGWLSILLLLGLGAAFGIGSVILSRLLGPKNPTPEKEAPYECGVPAVGDARGRHSIKFYLVAISFLLFDIEVAFTYPWAVSARELGWNGFVLIVIFFAFLLVGFVYEWKKGVLDWGSET